MTTGSDSEIIVQLTADTAQLQTGMDAGTTSVSDASSAMADVVNSAAQAMSSAFTGLTAAIQTAASQISAATAGISASVQATAVETAASSAVIVDAMDASTSAVVDTTEATGAAVVESSSAMASGVESAAASITEAAGVITASVEDSVGVVVQSQAEEMAAIAEEAAAFNAAVQAKIDAMVRLNAAFAGGITSTEGVAEAEAALDQAMATGAITAAEYTNYIGRLDAAEIDLAASTAEATVATDANTAAVTLNSRASAELGILMGELASGNASRMKRSLAALANQTGLLQKAVGFIFSPLGLLSVAMAGVAFEVFEAGQKFDAMEGTVLATGEAAGYTAGQLVGMADQIGQSSGNISMATDAIRELAASGRFAGQDLQFVGEAATDMAQLTGQSIQSAIAQIEKLQEDPVKAVAKLNDQYHFLTVAQFKEIEAAQQSGNSMKAASIAYEAMADKMEARTDELNQHANVLIRSWREMKTVWSESMQEINHGLGGGDSSNDLNAAKLLLSTLEKQKQEAQETGSSMLPTINLEIERQQKTVATLTAEFSKQAQAAASVGQAAQKSAEQIDAMAKASHKKHSTSGAHADHEQAQADRDGFNEQRLQHAMSLAEEKAYWQAKLAAAKQGTDAYRQAVNELLQIKSKEASESRSEARQEESDAKRVAAEKVRAAKEAERAQEEAARKQRALSLEQIKATHDEAVGSIANKREQYQQEYADGQISAAQLLQLESDLMTQKLAADRAYYEAKAKLDAADQVAVTKDNASIVKAQQDALASMLRYEKEFHNNSQKQWQSYAKKVEGAMQGAINGMLFQHETLRKGVANIALVMGEDFIQQAVMKPLDAWISGEASKIAAAMSTSTSLGVQRAANAAADAAASAASVARASGVAGAQGVASFAGAPWPVDMGAPAFGIAMAANAAAYGAVASAEGGWERVPADGMMTQLHKNEMVLPATVADHVRNSMGGKGAGSGGGSGGNNYHFHSFDSRGIYDYARRNPRDFAAAMKHVARGGHL